MANDVMVTVEMLPTLYCGLLTIAHAHSKMLPVSLALE
jgi:hypothetical protein